MTARPYNGFTPEDRKAACLWARNERAAGRLPALVHVCEACGQTEGRIEDHQEDYSAPYGVHVNGYMLCFWCHRMLHQRFSRPKSWGDYLGLLREGDTFTPIFENSYAKINSFVFKGRADRIIGPRRTTLLFDKFELSSSAEKPPSYLVEKLARHNEIMGRAPPPTGAIVVPAPGQIVMF